MTGPTWSADLFSTVYLEHHRAILWRLTKYFGLSLCLFVFQLNSVFSLAQEQQSPADNREPLQLYVFTAPESSYGVTSTLIYGLSEAILVDAQFHQSDAIKLADTIASKGRKLKSIFITHPDPDHYIGLSALHERFPNASIYMTATALGEFKKSYQSSLAGQKKSAPNETPDSLPIPEVLPNVHLSVDGQTVEVFENVQGDYADTPANSFLWIPSIQTVVAGDLAFNGVHPWLAGSTDVIRANWKRSISKVESLHPRTVVSGHKKESALPDSPAVLLFMKDYLTDFDEAINESRDADSFVAAMKFKYPNLVQERFLMYASKGIRFKKKTD